jgi:hypothetical protein
MRSTESIWSICREGFRRNRVPALFLQAIAASLLCLYFFVPALRPGFDSISELKTRTDPWFAMITTSVFGGLIPWAVSHARGRHPTGRGLQHLIAMLIYWACTGAIVDALYTLQDQWFGSGRDLATLMKKMLVDQGPFNLIWATPVCLTFFGWKETDFDWKQFRAVHSWPVIRQKYLTIQISCWIVWIPAVTMIYAMPQGLQQPLFNLVICFFSLLLVFLNKE